MDSLVGFELDIWDYLTFLTLLLCIVAVGAIWLWLAGLAVLAGTTRRRLA